ncbi:DUF4124 domain-containing protein [Vibrio cidicii]|uniref:DUF4124 domain-containing protein n=1 Tax=Vibrio cidicii TaxID=1763883 RepID=UPI000A917340|nr:DUF4124 domain-containing protein [Vibrio cidicii]ELV8625501.1 DUF4124 domain-containing protein [Vibrio cidicii]
MIKRLSLLCVLLSSLAHAQTVYTWVDADGVLHFSDTPGSGAKSITLPDLDASAPAPHVESTQKMDAAQPSTTQASSAKETAVEPAQPSLSDEAQTELQLSMASPANDATIRSNRGLLFIRMESNRKLEVGEQLQLILNGHRYGAPQTGLTWQLKNIDRGTHTLAVQAYRNGKIIASSSPISVHLHRTSIK